MPFKVHIFLPHHFLMKRPPYYLLGCYKVFDELVVVNSLFACPLWSRHEDFYDLSKKIHCVDDLNCYFGKVGAVFHVNDSRYNQYIEALSFDDKDLNFVFKVDRQGVEIIAENATFANKCISSQNIYLVLYNGKDVKESELLPIELTLNRTFENSFIQFLVETISFFSETKNLRKCGILSEKIPLYVDSPLQPGQAWFTSIIRFAIFFILQCFIFPVGWTHSIISKWWPHFCTVILEKTALGKQLQHRLLELKYVFEQVRKEKSLDICSKNLIASVIVDLAFGCVAVHYIHSYTPDHELFHNFTMITDDFVDWLQKLIIWLMGVPAGLKLNIPLNSVLGHIFLYHIYLWETYIVMVLPIFKVALSLLPLVGALGLTFLLSLFSDLLAFITMHIYCFYGYVSRLYYYQLCCIITLWRLFRGKKWNPENQKVESYTYGTHQLYVGTLLFTVLLFLLPTVMVYYFVFAALRMMVLFVQGLLSRLIRMLTELPIYAVILRICNSVQTAGGVHFSVLKSDNVLVLQMEVVQIDMLSVMKYTIPSLETYEQPLSWQSFLSYLLWGKIIYPI